MSPRFDFPRSIFLSLIIFGFLLFPQFLSDSFNLEAHTTLNNHWDTMPSTPEDVLRGGALTHADGHDTIYAFKGDSTKVFWGFSLDRDTWVRLADAPDTRSLSPGLLHVPGTDTVYATQNTNGNRGFWGYSISENNWTNLSDAPGQWGIGGSLAYAGADTIYATQGGREKTFWAYSIDRDTWITLAQTPSIIGAGGNLIHQDNSDTLFALRGEEDPSLFTYSISRDTWIELQSAPKSIGDGGDLVYLRSGDTLYVQRGRISTAFPEATDDFLSYDISKDAWTVLNSDSLPKGVSAGGNISRVGNKIFSIIGGINPDFYRYTVVPDDLKRSQSVVNDTTSDLDVPVIDIGSMRVTIGNFNGEQAFRTGSFSTGDTLSVFAQRSDSEGLSADIINPSYGFNSEFDIFSAILDADSEFFNSSRQPVGDTIISLSIWKNNPDTSSNYVGSPDTLVENSTVGVRGINFRGNSSNLQVAKLLPGNAKWVITDSDPDVSGSSGNFNLTFTVSSDTSVEGSGFSLFRVITNTGGSPSSDDCLIERTGLPESLQSELKSIRERILTTRIGRSFVSWYYEI